MADHQIEIGSAISYGWESVKKNFWYFVGIALFTAVIGGVGGSDNKTNIWDLVGFFTGIWMTCGSMTLYLSFQRGQKLPFDQLFSSVKKYWSVLGATVIVCLAVGLGLILLIAPGVYLALRCQFVIPLIIDRGLGITAALKESARLTQGRKMGLLRFDLSLLGVIILGAICLGIGILVAIPVVYLASVQVYRQLVTSTAGATA